MIFLEYPKCTTCKKAKKWLDDHGVAYEDRNIKEQNPTRAASPCANFLTPAACSIVSTS